MNKALVWLLIIAAGVLVGWYTIKNPIPGVSLPTQTTPQPTGVMDGTSGTSGATGTNNVPSIPTGAMGTDKGGQPVASSGVTYSDSGFTPARITVKKGTSVTFTNSSNANMWVASDVHPTHQLLPGFDAMKAVARGGVYTYTFTRVGTWGYHNHLNPTHGATVVVTE